MKKSLFIGIGRRREIPGRSAICPLFPGLRDVLTLLAMLTGLSAAAQQDVQQQDTTQPQVVAQRTVDVHCHNVMPEFVELLERHGAALEEGFPLPAWEVDSHLRFMDEAGIGYAVLTMPAPQPYFGDREESIRFVRSYNDACAQLQQSTSGRMRFCAALPLPDVGAAVDEAIRALDSLGAVGVKLATNSRGLYVGDPALDTLMATLDARRAVVILHPHRPDPVNDRLLTDVPLAAYEYPAETTRAVLNLLAHNVPARYPNLRFIVPHCGSFLPLALPRVRALYATMVARGFMEPIDWEANLRGLWYDLAGNPSPDVVRALLTIAPPERLLYGSDYPYLPATVLAGNLKRLREWLASDAELSTHAEAILGGNAAELFDIIDRK